jgi:hypothetical protein
VTHLLSSRSVLRGGVLAAALLTLAACGGIADDAPNDADLTEFCNTYYNESQTAEQVAKKLADVGTPKGISSSERNGFEVYVDGLDDEGDTPNKDLTEVKIPADDKADGTAFVAYAKEACSTVDPSADPSVDPSVDPSADPSATETP